MLADASCFALSCSGFAFFALFTNMLFSSKCEYVKCCCIEFQRNKVEEPLLIKYSQV